MDKSKWEYKKLGEVCDLYQPKTISSDMLVPDGKYLVYGANGVIGKYNKYNHENSEVLMTCRGATCGTINVSAPYSWINGNAMVVHPRTIDLNAQYLVYQLKAADKTSVITGAAQPQITRQMLQTLPFVVAPITDQQRIVAELDCLNEMIALKQEQLKEFDTLAQSIFYDMFGDKDFPMYQLKDILSKIGSGATPSGGNQSYKTEGISLIRSLNVHNNLFVYKDLAFIDEQQAKQLNNVTIEEGDVLLNITGASVARCCVVPNDVIPARVNQHVSILRPRKELLDSLYLCHFLISCDEQAKLLSLSKSKAATREALPKNLLEKYMIKLPPLALQQQFAEKIQAIEAQKELIKKSIAETQQLLDSRMDYYFD